MMSELHNAAWQHETSPMLTCWKSYYTLVNICHYLCHSLTGLVTYADGSNGFPRNEGFFQDCRFMRKARCPQVIQRAQKVAHIARAQMDQ